MRTHTMIVWASINRAWIEDEHRKPVYKGDVQGACIWCEKNGIKRVFCINK